MAQKIQIEVERIGLLWCNVMHDAPRWPIHGKYECGACAVTTRFFGKQQTSVGLSPRIDAWAVVFPHRWGRRSCHLPVRQQKRLRHWVHSF
jgi:hypothetical protein